MGSAFFSPILDGDLHLELVRLLVQEQDAERAVVDDAPRELRDPRQQLVEIEHRRDFAADLGERLERLGVVPLLLEEPRVDERGRDVRRELPQDVASRSEYRSRSRLSTFSAPIDFDLWMSGTASVDAMPGTTSM